MKLHRFFVRNVANYFSLLTSTSTLLCCALPAFLSIFVGGLVVSQYVSLFPWLITVSKYKIILFTITGFLLIVNGVLLFRNKSCPIEKKQQCQSATKSSKIIFIIAVVFYLIAILFSYLIPFLMDFF